MGNLSDLRESGPGARPIVAFDFDGTLTVRDSFTTLLRWKAGPVRFGAGVASLAPELVSFLMTRDRGALKGAAAKRFFGPARKADIESVARRFAEIHARDLFRPDAVRVWKRWRSRGARLVIVTASPEETVAPFARGLGADLLIGTRLKYDEAGRFTGKLDGLNCRGEEKVRRLREVFGPDLRLVAAYGDTDGDTAMLALADEAGMKVFNGVPVAATHETRRRRRS
ncbi:HAD-IB family hydrolase [Phenylobacterium montanum]|uniref:HAD-IB family hydrolase n=1 Tax=Phenylobacterium montanum TaxID=2823693 RepID=A0A975G3U2_9CAUL|nr:HAD-IB family hydrolase [Caulobacter sp. S6]QUD90628.1 HAD-IB family hydrolase [Caulobacter sp. S6]